MFRSTQEFNIAMAKILNAINQQKSVDDILAMFDDSIECYDALTECIDCNYVLNVIMTSMPFNDYNISLTDARLTYSGLEFLEEHKDLLS